jgi:hypothetical protein
VEESDINIRISRSTYRKLKLYSVEHEIRLKSAIDDVVNEFFYIRSNKIESNSKLDLKILDKFIHCIPEEGKSQKQMIRIV